jgi:hypothetical protein
MGRPFVLPVFPERPDLAIGRWQMPHAASSVAAMDDDASLRISDAEREQTVISLREHPLAGRLTLEEFSERVEATLRARIGAELARPGRPSPGRRAGRP